MWALVKPVVAPARDGPSSRSRRPVRPAGPTEVLAAQHVSSLKRLLSQVGPINGAQSTKGTQGKGAQGSELAVLPGLEVRAADKVYLLTASMQRAR